MIQVHIRTGRELRALRKALGLSRRQLATLLEIPLTRLDRWEAGRSDKTGIGLYLLGLPEVAEVLRKLREIEAG